MKTNNDFLQKLSEAQKILEYTLLLPKISPCNDTINPVETSLLYTYQNCHCRLYEKTLDIFGSCINSNSWSFSISTNNSICESLDAIYKQNFFASTILSHCLISAYDAIIQCFFNSTHISRYKLCQFEAKGFNELYITQQLEKNASLFMPKRYNKEYEGHKNDSFQNFNNKIKRRFNYFQKKHIDSIFFLDEKPILSMSDILFLITQLSSKDLNTFFSLYENENSLKSTNASTEKQNWYAISNFFKDFPSLESIIDSKNSNINDGILVDKLYLYYKTERFFNIQLANCLFHELKNLEDHYPDCSPSNIASIKETLSLICNFPNIFSRNLYLQYAFDAIHHKNNLYSCFDKPIDGVFVDNKMVPFSLPMWSLLFRKYCRFFCQYMFPAEEWFFFITLLKTLEPNFPLNIKDNEIHNILQKAQKELVKYIAGNIDKILSPLSLMHVSPPVVPPINENINNNGGTNPPISSILCCFKNYSFIRKEPLSTLNKDNFLPLRTTENNSRNQLIKSIHKQYIDSIINA